MVQIIDSLGSVLLNWNEADCLEGISHYRVYMNDEICRNVFYNSLQIDDLLQNKEYSFYIVGVTNENRITDKSNTVTIKLVSGFQVINLNFNLNTYI